jgi:hypothetical protein
VAPFSIDFQDADATTTLAGILFPTVADGQVVIGFVIVDDGTGSNFVPGTTALDTGSLTVTYINTPYPFIPGLEPSNII